MNTAVPMTFETKKFLKFSSCLENLSYFADSCNVIHESSQCMLGPCLMKCFSDELFSYVSRRRSLRLESYFFRNLCAKYPQAFHDIFLAAKHKKLFLDFFNKKDEISPGNSTAVKIEKEIERFNSGKRVNQFVILCLHHHYVRC